MEAANPSAAGWTTDPTARSHFFNLVAAHIDGFSKYWAKRYGVEQHDISAETRLKLLQKMEDVLPEVAFCEPSPEEAAETAYRSFVLYELTRSAARKLAKKRSLQAEWLDNVEAPHLPPDIQSSLLAVSSRIKAIVGETSTFTQTDATIFTHEALRRVDIDDLSGPSFDEAARLAGTTGEALSNHLANYRKHGGLNPRERKAWSRAMNKVRTVLTTSLMMFAALSPIAVASDHQSGVHQLASGHQGAVAIHQLTSDHQSGVHQLASSHQGAIAHQLG